MKHNLTELEGETEKSIETGTSAPIFTNRMTAFPANILDDLDKREIPGITTLVTLPREEIESLRVYVYTLSLSCVLLFATPWTAAHEAPPFIEFSRQESWSG